MEKLTKSSNGQWKLEDLNKSSRFSGEYIGTTASGKKIKKVGNKSFAGWTKQDHEEASGMHAQAADALSPHVSQGQHVFNQYSTHRHMAAKHINQTKD